MELVAHFALFSHLLGHWDPGLAQDSTWEEFLDELPVVLKAAHTVLEKICPRFAVTIRSRVQQCLQQHFALVVPNAKDEAVVKAIESLDSLEWSDWIQLIEQLCDPVQSLLTALRQQRGYEALQTADPISLTFLWTFFIPECVAKGSRL